MTSTRTIQPTGNSAADGLIEGQAWATRTLSFSFPQDASFYGPLASYSGAQEPGNHFTPFTATQASAVREALAMYAAVSGLSFVEVAETATQHGELRFAGSDAPPTAWAYSPSTAAVGGDAWFNVSNGFYANPVRGNYAWDTIIHETGHALGLKHPHETSGSFGLMPSYDDSLESTIMSYRAYVGASTTTGYPNEPWSYAQTPMRLDILAIQELYGANFNTHSENTVYRWDPSSGQEFINGVGQGAPGGGKIFATVWDGGGVDTYDFSNFGGGITIDLRPGQSSLVSQGERAVLGDGHVAQGNVYNAHQYHGDGRSLIENAVAGSGNDTVRENAANNAVDGGGGDDMLVFESSFAASTATQAGGTVVFDGPDGHDTATNFEHFRFADGTIDEADGKPLTDDLFYFSQNKDVWNAQIDAETHFDLFGWREGRNPDAYFNTKGYLEQNPDVAAAGINPLFHYDTYGWKEGRDPSAGFDTKGYLAANPDVAAAHMDPLAHYLQFGRYEGRIAVTDGHWG